MKKVVVKVTRKHIVRGKQDNAVFCPVALALKEAFPNLRCVLVDTKTVSFRNGWAQLPRRVINFIKRFDNTKSVKPFSFSISL